MRKILLVSLLTITIVSCAKKEEVKNFTEVNSTDELFELKSSINETNSVDFLKAKLDLDGFQEAVVRNLVADNQEKSKEIMDSTTYSDVEKREMIKEIADDFTFKIKKSLSPEQIVKYEKLIKRK